MDEQGIGADEDPANYHAYADYLLRDYKVLTIYLYPDITTPDLINYIGTTGVSMIGTVPPEQQPAGWVMTIEPDVTKAIQNAWPGLISGQGGITVQSPLGLADVDREATGAGQALIRVEGVGSAPGTTMPSIACPPS